MRCENQYGLRKSKLTKATQYPVVWRVPKEGTEKSGRFIGGEGWVLLLGRKALQAKTKKGLHS